MNRPRILPFLTVLALSCLILAWCKCIPRYISAKEATDSDILKNELIEHFELRFEFGKKRVAKEVFIAAVRNIDVSSENSFCLACGLGSYSVEGRAAFDRLTSKTLFYAKTEYEHIAVIGIYDLPNTIEKSAYEKFTGPIRRFLSISDPVSRDTYCEWWPLDSRSTGIILKKITKHRKI